MDIDDHHAGRPALDEADPPGQADPGLLDALVFALAPRLFAIVAEPAGPADIHVAAWGLQFPNEVVVVRPDGQVTGSFTSLDRALWIFSYLNATLHVVWHAQPRIARPHQPRRRIIRLRR